MEPKGAPLAEAGLGACKVEPSLAVACLGSAAPASKRRRVEAMANRRHHRRINDRRRYLCPKSESLREEMEEALMLGCICPVKTTGREHNQWKRLQMHQLFVRRRKT